MDYLKTNIKWEDFFTRESAELEEKMQTLDMDSLSKSKIRLSLENNILNWQKYEAWALENIGCASVKSSMSESDLENLTKDLHSTLDKFSSFDFWGEDLAPVMMWESQLIIFGIQYNENLVSIPNHIFILAPPQIMNYITAKLTKSEGDSESADGVQTETQSGLDALEGLALDVKPLGFDFKSLSTPTAAAAPEIPKVPDIPSVPPIPTIPKIPSIPNIPAAQNLPKIPSLPDPVQELTTTKKIEVETTDADSAMPESTQFLPKEERQIWEFVNERHNEYSFEVKKQFTAYLVLKVDYDKTRVYKMDADLEKDNVNEQLFNYSLKEDNPFKRVFESGEYESFSVSQLGLNLRNFKYACITALKCGKKVVGFLVGFKDKNLSEIDQILLEELAKETAS